MSGFIALAEARCRAFLVVVIAAIVGSALIGGIGVRDASAAPVAAPSKVAPAGDFVQIRGGSPAQRRLARLVALRVGGVTIREVRFGPPRRVLRNADVHGTEMFVTSSQPRTVRGEWEMHLYSGTFAALLARYRVPLSGISAGDGEGPLRLWPTFDLYSQLPTSREVGVLVGDLVSTSIRAGAKVVEERTAATPARAIALTLQVSDPAAFLKHRALGVLNVLYKTKVPLLGFYVGLKDARGQLVWATSRLPNEGSVYAIPSLDACSPVTHSEALGAKQLPCPAH